jgi:hypothetical protein
MIGMGGVGKTMLTAAVIRDERVRGAFEKIAWVNLSQIPDLLLLQKRCYQMLHVNNEEMPKKANSIGSQAEELKLVTLGRTVLITLGM